MSRGGETQAHNSHHLLAASAVEVGLVNAAAAVPRSEAASSLVMSNPFSSSQLHQDGGVASCTVGVNGPTQSALCLTESKVTFLSLGAFSTTAGNLGASMPFLARKDSSSASNDQQEPRPMSRFMNLARKFNCFYFNGNIETKIVPRDVAQFVFCVSF